MRRFVIGDRVVLRQDIEIGKKYNTIYFSSREIAEKCADWLNEIDPNGNLID